jgi:restriction system protein
MISRPRRAVYAITDHGRTARIAHPERIDMRVFNEFPEYREFRSRRRERESEEPVPAAPETPIERMEGAKEELEDALATQLLERIRQSSPAFFEQLVLDVLGKMGYGGSEPEFRRGDSRPLGTFPDTRSAGRYVSRARFMTSNARTPSCSTAS